MAIMLNIFITIAASLLFTATGQSTSLGREFRLVFMDNYVLESPVSRPVDLHICNPALNSTAFVNVSLPYFTHRNCPSYQRFSVAVGGCQFVTLCDEARHTYQDGSRSNKVVVVNSDVDVSVTGFNAEMFSADSFVVLPWSEAGMIHYVLSYNPQHIQTQFSIVAKEVTLVRIVIPDRVGETITVDYNGVRYSNGDILQFTLHPSMTFLSQSAGDVSGVLIQTDNPVAVFTGNVRTYVTANKKSRDHLVEQVLPTSKWGQDFIYVPTPRNIPRDTVKIMARKSRTNITLVGMLNQQTVDIPAGGLTVELELNEVTHIRSNQPILVAVIVHSQDGRFNGLTDPADPSMYFLPSINQYYTKWQMPRFLDSRNIPYQKTWVLVAVREGYNISIDGIDPVVNSSPLITPTSSVALPYLAGAIEVSSSTTHSIESLSEEGIMVIAYGASDRESFASTLGYFFPLGCTDSVPSAGDNTDNDCDGETDEEICADGVDNDGDGLMDEDCSEGQPEAVGNSFALAFQTNIVQDSVVNIDEIELYISALEPDTQVTITAPIFDGPESPQIFNLNASLNTVVQVMIDSALRVGNVGADLGKSTLTTKGIKVTATKDIVLYGINKKQYSTDGFLALPDSVIGSDYYAYCNFPINTNDDRCQFAVVATENNTKIYIELPVDVTIDPLNGVSYIGPKRFTVNMRAYEVLEIQSQDDLTGTRVYNDNNKRFSFFSGNIRTRVPINRSSRDHLVEQLPSVDTWGVNYSVISTPRVDPIGDIWKVIASTGNTQLNYTLIFENETQTFMVDLTAAGSSFTIDTGFESPMAISANHPILVVQISKSATQKDTDPAAIVIPPENQWSNNYRFVTPLSGQMVNGNQLPFDNYVMIAVKKENQTGLYFESSDGNRTELGEEQGWIDVPGTDNAIILYQIPSGQNFIAHDEDIQFMAVSFGRADRETYGNAIGLRLQRKCIATQQVDGDRIDNDCDGRIDEEACNGIDDDLDEAVDEDCNIPPQGYKYYLVFQENVVEYPRNYALEVYVGNPNNVYAYCRLRTPNKQTPYYDQTITVPPGSAQEFAVSAHLRVVGTRSWRNSITVECDQPVTAMGVNKEAFSNDAFIAYEAKTFGTEYYTMHFGPATIQTQFAIVAADWGYTQVNMSFKSPVVWRYDTYDELNITLRRDQIFQAQSDGDLTGSRISATQRIAVFSGNIRTKVALSASRDHLASQLPPINSWGKEFMIVPLYTRTVGDLYRVMAQEQNTTINYRDSVVTLSSAGDWIELDVNSANLFNLTSDKPILVMQIVKSQEAPEIEEAADPCFILVAPTSQYVQRTTLVTPLYSVGFYASNDSYNNLLTIIVPTGTDDGILINEERISPVQVRNIQNSDYIAVDYLLNIGGMKAYTLTHNDSNVSFSGYLVGIADRESYCVTVGLNLPELV